MLHSYTHLLGETLIAARFALIGDERHELIYLDDHMIKKYPAGKYSLKAIKRYCSCYLLDQASSGTNTQLTLPSEGTKETK